MNKGSRAFSGFLSDAVGGVLIQLINITVTPLYLSYLGSATLGIWYTILAVIGWVSLGDFGLEMAASRYILSRPIANSGRLNFTYILFFLLFTLFSAIVILLFYAIGVNKIELLSSLTIYKVPLIICLITLYLRLVFSILKVHLISHHLLSNIHINRNISQIIGICISLFLVLNDFGILSLAFGYLATASLNIVLDLITLKWNAIVIPFHYKILSKNEISEISSFGGYFQIGKISNTLLNQLDLILIGFYLGSEQVTAYTLNTKLAFFIVIGIMSKLPSALFPSITNLISENKKEKVFNALAKINLIVLRSAFLFACIFFLINKTFVLLWVGEEILISSKYFNILVCIWIIIEAFIRGVSSFIFATSNIKGWSMISLVESISNAGITLFFLKKGFGIEFVIFATIFSRIVFTTIYIPKKISKISDFKISDILKILSLVIRKSSPMLVFVIILDSISFTNKILYLILSPLAILIINALLFDWDIFKANKSMNPHKFLKGLKIKYKIELQ